MCNIYKYLIILFFVRLCSFECIKAQVIEIVSVEEDRFVEAEFSEPVLDSNGDACALIHIVGLSQTGFSFEGNIVKSVASQNEHYLSMPASSRRLRIKHPDYWTSEIDFRNWNVKLKGGDKLRVELSAEKIPIDETLSSVKKGTFLSVKTSPYGSDIKIDDKIVGQSPWVSKIKAGVHSLEISKENYLSLDTTLVILKNTTTNISGLLTKIEPVCFLSNAPESQVWIDGIKMGQVGDTIMIPVGEHQLFVKSNGYYGYCDSILISPNQKNYEVYLYKRFKDITKTYQGVTLTFIAIGDSLHHDYCELKSSSLPKEIDKSLKEDNRFPESNSKYFPNKDKAIRLSQVLDLPISFDGDHYTIKDYSDVILSLENLDGEEETAHKRFLRGIGEIKGKDYINAFRMFKSAWEMGDFEDEVISALTWMGFETIIKIPHQYAADRYLQLANSGFPKALYVMGWLYENGLYFQKDLNKAREMYEKAASVGDKASLWQLGWFAEKGYADNPNVTMAAFYYNLAENAFKEQAIHGTQPEESEAIYAIEQQLANKFSINELYAKGNVGKEHHATAYLKEAAHLGHFEAMREVSCIDGAIIGDELSMLSSASIVDGRYVPFFIKDLALKNNAVACEKLGRYYGEEKIDSCLYWLKKAVDLGNINAVQHLEKAVENIADIKKSYEVVFYIANTNAIAYEEPNGSNLDFDLFNVLKGDTLREDEHTSISVLPSGWLEYVIHAGGSYYYKQSDFYTKVYNCTYLINTKFINKQGILQFESSKGNKKSLFRIDRNGYMLTSELGIDMPDTLYVLDAGDRYLVYIEQDGFINIDKGAAFSTLGSDDISPTGKLLRNVQLPYLIAFEQSRAFPFVPYEVAILDGVELYRYKPNDRLSSELQDDSSAIYTVVEQEPQFPGGTKALMEFISKNLSYPTIAAKNGVQGRVTLSFVVEKDGSVSDIQEMRSPSEVLTKEAMRVVQAMPKWKCGKLNGKPVRVKYMLPITFRMQ